MDGIQFEANQHSCPLLPVLSVRLFIVPRLSFAFSHAFATCVEREVISCPPRDPPSRIFLLFYDPYKREYRSKYNNVVFTQTQLCNYGCCRDVRRTFFLSEKYYPRLSKVTQLESGYYLCSEMVVMRIMERISVAAKYYDYSRSN